MSNTINEEDRKRITAQERPHWKRLERAAFRAGAEWGLEHARKELAELKAQVEKFKTLYKLTADKISYKRLVEQDEIIAEQTETLKRYKDALEAIKGLRGHSNSHIIIRKTFDIVESALSGTKETE